MDINYADMLEDYLHYSKFPRPVKHVQDNPGFNLTWNVQLTRENQLRLNAMKPLIVGKNIDYLYSNIELKSILDYIIVETLKVCPPNPAAFLSKLFTEEDIEKKLEKQKILIKKKMKSKKNGSLFSLDEVTDWGRVMEELEWEERGERRVDEEEGEVERIIRGTSRGQGWLSKERNRLGERREKERRRRSKGEGLECEEDTDRERGELNKEGEEEQERTGRSSGVQGSIGGEELNKDEETGERKRSSGQGLIGEKELNREKETGERKRSTGQGWIGEKELNREKETGERKRSTGQGWIGEKELNIDGETGERQRSTGQGSIGEEELNKEENIKTLKEEEGEKEEEIALERTSRLMSKEEVVDKDEKMENGVERKSKEVERIDEERIVKEERNGRGIMKRTSKGQDSDSETNKSEEEFSCHNLLYIRKPRRHSLFRKDDGFNNDSKRTPKISFKNEEVNEEKEEGEVVVVAIDGEEGENGGREVGEIQEEEVKGKENKENERDGKEEEEDEEKRM
ncbi:spore wall protein 2-like [Nilaparvata lugens]|uniref:spore wall protein 2-like n=1 Tax=Nilaparvata lugens TaxID=108931 RepID=UPI00193EB595|nr:spore wall protein 2-like [Nilaparvata lugens]